MAIVHQVDDEPARHRPPTFHRAELQPHDLVTHRRAVIVLGSACTVPEPGCLYTVRVVRAPAGAEPFIDGPTVIFDRAGAYALRVESESSAPIFALVVVPPESLDLPGLGATPILTLMSLAQDSAAFSDERWDELHSSEHAFPFHGVALANYGGDNARSEINSNDTPAPRAPSAWASVARNR